MKVIIVTGLSGAGKTQAIDCLEDMGYYCIDNMPPALIKSFIDLSAEGKGIDKAAFVIDVRGGRLFDDLKESLEELSKEEIDYKILYLEAADKTLLRRYNETRRVHPLSEGGSVELGLKREREMLSELRKHADFIVDTSNMKSAQL
ncbi:MAG: RNase adaptor protein RapZ, partial [Firmicutes bacterium]|nr:RNase adaptor protein RapZ [Bacillota bacterium]